MPTLQEWINGTANGVRLDGRKVAAFRKRHPELSPQVATARTASSSRRSVSTRPTRPRSQPIRTGGPGTELSKLLTELGISAKSSCSCKSKAAEMDRVGVAGIRKDRQTWINHLTEAYHASGWWEVATAAARAVVLGLPKTIDGLLDEAMKRAEAKQPPGPGKLIGIPIDRTKLVAHILYHVQPVAGDAEWIWRRHMDWLREVRPQYNGRLIVGIVTPGPCDEWRYCPPDAVKESLAGLDAEFIEAPNDVRNNHLRMRDRRAGRGEGVLYPKMLAKLLTSDPNQLATYFHCKGVTRADHSPDKPPHLWAEVIFETLFRNQAAVIDALDTHGICGPLRMRGGFAVGKPGLGPNWFFSGTGFAMRLADVFARKWQSLPKHYGCVEQWPRLMFKMEEAACLFMDGIGNLYDEELWRSEVTPAFQQWKAERETGASMLRR